MTNRQSAAFARAASVRPHQSVESPRAPVAARQASPRRRSEHVDPFHRTHRGGFAGGRPNDTRYDPTYDPLVSPGPGAAGSTRRPTGSRRPAPAARRRPRDARSRCRRRDHRRRLHGPRDRAVPRAGPRHQGRRAGSQPHELGLQQPQRRAGAERIGPAVALAVDRALGQGRRAEDARRDPRRLRELQVARGGNRLRPAAWRPFPDRASSAHHGQARGRGEGVEGRIRLSVRAAERRNLPPRIHQRPRSGRRAARAGRHRHPRAEARVRLPAPRARSRREGAYEQPGARLRDDRRRASPAHARRRRAAVQSASRPARTPRRRCIRRCAAR